MANPRIPDIVFNYAKVHGDEPDQLSTEKPLTQPIRRKPLSGDPRDQPTSPATKARGHTISGSTFAASPLLGENVQPFDRFPSWKKASKTESNTGRVDASKASMNGRIREIGLAFLALALPITALTVTLIVLIYRNILPSGKQYPAGGSNYKAEACPSGVYVNYPATQLTFISSWISTLASYVSIPAMTLISFRVGRIFIRDAKTLNSSSLPTPYQLQLLISLIGGGILSLWHVGKYTVLRRKRRPALARTIGFCVTVLGFTIILSILCQVVDTWLHEETSSVLYTKYVADSSAILYGRKLSAHCTEYYSEYVYSSIGELGEFATGFNDSRMPCSVEYPDTVAYIVNATEAYRLSSAPTDLNTITLFEAAFSSTPLQNYTLLLPSNPKPGVDWTADTIGVSSSCIPILQQCNFTYNPLGSPLPSFNCSDSDLPLGINNSTFVGFFNGSSSDAIGADLYSSLILDRDTYNLPNPYSIAIAAGLIGLDSSSPLYHSPHVMNTDAEYTATAVMCTTSVWDVSYASINGSVTLQSAHLADTNTSQTINGPVAIALLALTPFLVANMAVALYGSNTIDELLGSFANSYSHLTLATGASALEAAPALSASTANTSIVSCIPLAPLWSLIGLAAIYLFFGILLTIIALSASTRDNVRSVQAQLSVAGLAAAAFEKKPSQTMADPGLWSPEEMFEECRYYNERFPKDESLVDRVGFGRNGAGHWEYEVRGAAATEETERECDAKAFIAHEIGMS